MSCRGYAAEMARVLKDKNGSARPWLDAYSAFMSDAVTPPQYILWSGIAAIATMLKRQVYFERKLMTIYPNQYIVLVGPPAAGKGNAMRPTVDLLGKAGATHLIQDRITAERIAERLSQLTVQPQPQPSGPTAFTIKPSASITLVAEEAALLLEASTWMLQALCTMWDKGEFSYETKNKGAFAIKDVCVSAYCGCVPEYIQSLSQLRHMETVSGGFSSRCIFPYSAEAIKENELSFWLSLPRDGEHTRPKFDELVHDLREIGRLYGKFKFTADAAAEYARFCTSLPTDKFDTTAVVNFRSRMWAHVGKAALCISASRGESHVINIDDMKQACAAVQAVHDSLDQAFRHVSDSPMAEAMIKVMDYIEMKGMASIRDLLRALYRVIPDKDQMVRIVTALLEMEFCTTKTVGNISYYTHNPAFNKATLKVRGKGAS